MQWILINAESNKSCLINNDLCSSVPECPGHTEKPASESKTKQNKKERKKRKKKAMQIIYGHVTRMFPS